MAENDKTPEKDAAPEAEAETSLDDALAGSALLSSGAVTPTAVETTDELEQDEDEYDDHDEVGTPLSSKILAGLGILIAGGVIALWAGPKIAPSLPAGMEPVRAWLMPGAGVSEDDLVALRDDLEAQIAVRPEGLDEDRIAEMIGAVQMQDAGATEAVEALRDRLAELSDQIDALDRADLPTRIGAVETRLEGISGQLESLGTLAESADGLSEDAVAQISKFAAMVDGLRSEIGALNARDGELAERLDAVAASTERRITETEDELAQTREKAAEDLNRAVIRTALTEIDGAISAGVPYADALERLSERLDSPLVDQLRPMAADGVATLAELRAGFGDAAHAAIRTEIKSQADDSALDRLGAIVGSQIASRSLTPQEGDSTDAVLSRAEDKLRRDDLPGSVAELRALPAAAAQAMAAWSDRAQARLDAEQALDALAEMTQAGN